MKNRKQIFVLSLFTLLTSSKLWAQTQVFPTHLTLTEETPSSYVNLKNTNDKPQKYHIELVQFLMNKDGTMSKSPTVNSPLTDLLKFSPKEIEVPANEKQVVRVMATSFDNLTDGEYYIYLHFIPDSDAGAEDKAAKKVGGKFNLQAKVAVAVPVIVRKGAAQLNGKLQGLNVTKSSAGDVNVQFKLSNTTKYFLTGDLEIIGVGDKSETSLTKITGVSSYVPERLVTTKLSQSEIAAKLSSENIKKIKVHYVSNADSAAPFDMQADAEIGKASTATAAKSSGKKRR